MIFYGDHFIKPDTMEIYTLRMMWNLEEGGVNSITRLLKVGIPANKLI
jgi:hypothetical protein